MHAGDKNQSMGRGRGSQWCRGGAALLNPAVRKTPLVEDILTTALEKGRG